MQTVIPSVLPGEWTVADMLTHLGGIPPERIRLVPPPGTATERDALESKPRFGRVCELIDGVLVEKTMGSYESLLAAELIFQIKLYLQDHDLGIVLAPDGLLRLSARQVRAPDVSFISWDRFPGRQLPDEPIYGVAPDLAVEVLSAGNTPREMQRKRDEYFRAGVRCVWYLDPRTQTARIYTAADQCQELPPDGMLRATRILPGFALPLADLFRKTGN